MIVLRPVGKHITISLHIEQSSVITYRFDRHEQEIYLSAKFFFLFQLNIKIADVCVGPLLKYAVFDAFFGILCSLLLIGGARQVKTEL